MAYKFDKIRHLHALDDKPLCGVTTVLAVIAKPALIQWAANMAVDHIANATANIAKFSSDYMKDLATDWETILKDARVAHRTKKEKAGDWGTVVHKKIEMWIKNKKEPTVDEAIAEVVAEHDKVIELTEEQRATIDVVFNKFKAWSEENKVEFLESEKNVWSREYWIGGIVDLVLKIDGKKYMGDIKTSSGIYDEAFFQMGAYDLCLKEMGEHTDTEGYIVFNLKKDGKLDFKRADNTEINRLAFLHALGLYKIMGSLK